MFVKKTMCNFLILGIILLVLFTPMLYQAGYGQGAGNLTSSNDNTQSLHVSIGTQKNPVGRGDNQSITITVTDSNSMSVSGAEIVGKLKYPGGNYEKDFSGITDTNGKFVNSWTIGKNGDLGELVIEVEVTSLGYDSQSVASSFELVDPLDSSIMNNGKTNLIEQSPGIQKDGFDLVAAGDYGCNAISKEVVNKMNEKDPDLVLAIGDLSEDKNPSCFFDLFSKINHDGKLKIALGEHDTDSNTAEDSSSRFSQYMRQFDLAKPFYSFNYQKVHFLAMSTGKYQLIPFAFGSPQYNFVANDLAQASQNPEIDWIIVYGYRPFYSSPTVHPGPMALRDLYHPLFEKYGVDLVITAHNHNYQRTYPLKMNGVSQSDPIVTDRNNSDYINPGGPIFVTVGTAGQDLYDLMAQYPFVVTQFKRNGFLGIHISNNGTELTGTFYDTINGDDGDYFTITKL
jgi:hypothetical protein